MKKNKTKPNYKLTQQLSAKKAAQGKRRNPFKERGVEEMDEYVVDLSGIGYNSENGKTLSEFSQKCAKITFEKAFVCLFEKEQDPKEFVDKLMVAMQAHFSLGVGVALNRMGMS